MTFLKIHKQACYKTTLKITFEIIQVTTYNVLLACHIFFIIKSFDNSYFQELRTLRTILNA